MVVLSDVTTTATITIITIPTIPTTLIAGAM
jgi:hypothetical protein